VNSSRAVLVAARGSAVSVSCRGIGSANGNRRCVVAVQPSPVESKCLQTRPTGIAGRLQSPLRSLDVVTRLSLVDWPIRL
jgi:hypothetical protein